jgi:hypothetical protein
MTSRARAVLLLFSVFTIGGFAMPAAATADQYQTVDGTVRLDAIGNEGAPCKGSGKVADIKVGAPVTVQDSKGHVIAKAKLLAGTLTEAFPGSDFVKCDFLFTMSVPSMSTYRFRVAKRDAGSITGRSLAANDGTVTISIH